MGQTTRINKKSDMLLKKMVSLTGMNKVEILEEALKVYLHYESMRCLNNDFERLRSNKKAWNEEVEERNILEGTLEDGLEEEDFEEYQE